MLETAAPATMPATGAQRTQFGGALQDDAAKNEDDRPGD